MSCIYRDRDLLSQFLVFFTYLVIIASQFLWRLRCQNGLQSFSYLNSLILVLFITPVMRLPVTLASRTLLSPGISLYLWGHCIVDSLKYHSPGLSVHRSHIHRFPLLSESRASYETFHKLKRSKTKMQLSWICMETFVSIPRPKNNLLGSSNPLGHILPTVTQNKWRESTDAHRCSSKLWPPDTGMLSVVTGKELAWLTACSVHGLYNCLLPNNHRRLFLLFHKCKNPLRVSFG